MQSVSCNHSDSGPCTPTQPQHADRRKDAAMEQCTSNRWNKIGSEFSVGADFLLRDEHGLKGIDCRDGADSSFSQFLNASTESLYSRARTSMTSNIKAWSSSFSLSAAKLDHDKTNPRLGRVLVVDDDFAACIMLQRMLTAMNFHCEAAMDGAEAVKFAQQNAFDLVITDVLMPVKNGWDVCAEIQSHPTAQSSSCVTFTDCSSSSQSAARDPTMPDSRKPALPTIVGVLSHDDESMRQRCADAGMAAVLVKPVDRAVSGARLYPRATTIQI
jgi:CheY-like chemotaxis protein